MTFGELLQYVWKCAYPDRKTGANRWFAHFCAANGYRVSEMTISRYARGITEPSVEAWKLLMVLRERVKAAERALADVPPAP